MSDPKTGQTWRSEAGRTVKILGTDRGNVHVEVERTVSKNDKQQTEVRKRTVPKKLWSFFARSYTLEG